MSAAARSSRSLRIIALPLTGPSTAHTPNRHADRLTYYHFVTAPSPAHKANSWSRWATSKAADLWAAFGKGPEGGWKRRTYLYGERLVDRLDFEELALKSVDPSIGPKLLRAAPHPRPDDHPTIPLAYPPTVFSSPLPHLRSLLAKRTPRHRKGFLVWALVAPLTAPFMLIPIIPNFPFFFCAWRSWSHYRAYKASQYLEAFLAQGAIVPQGSAELDRIYITYAPKAAAEKLADSARAAPAGLLLAPEAVPVLQARLELPPDSTFVADVSRALEQARLRLEGAAR
ncbi:mitochondrial K+-H+ exchange-related-domain-containing protein [Amylocystis lapponica]|nr:mitochondrial K+-H+ exchange-related-domain-containing protein [Amylocystis lapponica]